MQSLIKNLPKRFADKNFSNFNAYSENLNSIKQFCLEFSISASSLSTEKTSLVITGSVGAGKTHLAISILKNLPPIKQQPLTIYQQPFLRPQRSIFITADEFFSHINDLINSGNSKLQYINQISDFDMILLDDLNFNNFTPAKIENLYLLINKIYLFNKKIIITSNNSIKDFEHIDPRIPSRLSEIAHIIHITAPDYRLNNLHYQ